jgi:alpha-1,6-mannosyltransferase
LALKTLHLTNSWHATSGGIATFYRALMDASNRQGHFMHLVVPGESDRTEEVGEFGRIHHVKAPPARFNSQYRVIYPPQFLAPGSRVQNILAAERPDIVEICDKYTLNYFGALLRRDLLRDLNFRPVVVGLSCERMDDNFRTYVGRLPLSSVFCAAYVKWLYFPFFDHHIANSEYTAGELRAASQGQMVSRNVWIRPMGVDLHHFSAARKSGEARRELLRNLRGAHDDSVLLVYSGRLVPEKNLSLLFEVFAHLVRQGSRDYHLLIAGDGIERERWEAFSALHAPGRVSFLGHIKEPDQLANLLANADAFVHPNPREPFGIAPLEAMASGLPLVAPNCGGVATYATSENAWVAAPDLENFVQAIEALFGDAQETSRRADNALQTATAFSWDRVAASFLDLYAELHRAGVTRQNELPSAAFSSTPAKGVKLAFSRVISQSAEKAFRLASNVLWG